jgi:hypothetical protein
VRIRLENIRYVVLVRNKFDLSQSPSSSSSSSPPPPLSSFPHPPVCLLLLLQQIVTVLCPPQGAVSKLKMQCLYHWEVSNSPVFSLLCTNRERSGDSESKTASSEAKQRRTACSVEESHQPTAAPHTHGEGECKTARYLFFFGACHSSHG